MSEDNQKENTEQKQWFVAMVSPRTEMKCAESLYRHGYETYVASQPEERTWSRGRKKIVDRVVISSMVFVKTTEQERLAVVAHNPYVKRFLVDRSRERNSYGRSPVAVISDREIDLLRYMLRDSDNYVEYQERHFTAGDRVKVLRGTLAGVEGVVRRYGDDRTELFVDLDILGSVKVMISESDVEKLE